MGFPTANVALGEFMEPKLGVYAVMAADDSSETPNWIRGVANLGRRPTVGGTRVQLEVHLFDFDESIYGAYITVRFMARLRSEEKFASLEALRRQMHADAAAAKAALAG